MKLLPELDIDFSSGLFLFFCLMGFFQLIWLLFVYLRLATHKDVRAGNLPALSVLIAARNEEDNLYHLIPKIMEQDYPEFEVIIINHQSIDDSKYILKAYEQQYKNLKIITVEKSKHLRAGKKLPLTIGIKGAKHNHLVFTDADCEPNSKNWLRLMGAQYSIGKEIVLGYGPYRKEKGLLNRLIRLDTAMIAMNYMSFAKAGMPYMGIGRNISYTRECYERVGGFKSHYALPSGDDDLFIQEAAKNKNYAICVDESTFSYSPAEKSLGSWLRQKSRHFTTTGHYKVFKKTMLGIYPMTLLFLYASFITLCLISPINWLTLIILGVLITVKWIIFGINFSKLKETGFVWALPLWDLLYAIMAPVIYYTSEKSFKTWK